MGYLYVVIAVFSGVSKGFLAKKLSGRTSTLRQAAFYNLLRMTVCVVIGFLLCTVQSGFGGLVINTPTVGLSLLYGIGTAAMAVSWLFAVQYSAYVMLDIFLVLGTVVPIIGSAILFGEIPSVHQIIGVLILCAAVYLMCGYSNSIKGKLTVKGIAILLVCGFSNGLSGLAQKMFSRSAAETGDINAAFNFYGYVFASITLLLVFLMIKNFSKTEKKPEDSQAVTPKIYLIIVLMSIFLFLNSFFQTAAAAELEASVLFPMVQGLSLVCSTVMSAIAFKERVNARSIAGTVIAFVGMVILNL